jgi:uncharacterized membrane protein
MDEIKFFREVDPLERRYLLDLNNKLKQLDQRIEALEKERKELITYYERQLREQERESPICSQCGNAV